jgi:hypothetical protein
MVPLGVAEHAASTAERPRESDEKRGICNIRKSLIA